MHVSPTLKLRCSPQVLTLGVLSVLKCFEDIPRKIFRGYYGNGKKLQKQIGRMNPAEMPRETDWFTVTVFSLSFINKRHATLQNNILILC